MTMRKLFCSFLVHIPLLKYFLYPARIVLRKDPDSVGLVHRYGVMPDGSEYDLGKTVDTARDVAEETYRMHLDYWADIQWLAPMHTKGSDFFPLDPRVIVHSEFHPELWKVNHEPARTWRERRAAWPEYESYKYIPEGHLKSARRMPIGRT